MCSYFCRLFYFIATEIIIGFASTMDLASILCHNTSYLTRRGQANSTPPVPNKTNAFIVVFKRHIYPNSSPRLCPPRSDSWVTHIWHKDVGYEKLEGVCELWELKNWHWCKSKASLSLPQAFRATPFISGCSWKLYFAGTLHFLVKPAECKLILEETDR